MSLANEAQQHFRDAHKGVLCCHIHTAPFDMTKGEQKPQCIRFTGEMARITATILQRELPSQKSKTTKDTRYNADN
jgi:hypothetical protein